MATLIAATLRPRSASATVACAMALQHYLRQCKSTGVDAIDCFTNDLVVRKTNKWKTLKEKLDPPAQIFKVPPAPGSAASPPPLTSRSITTVNANNAHQHLTLRAAAKRILQDLHGSAIRDADDVRLCVNLQTLSAPHIDQLLLSALLDDQPQDFYSLIDECLRWRKLPTDTVIVDCLRYLSQYAADTTYPAHLMALCAERNAPLYEAHADFAHFRARARWHRGEPVEALADLAAAYATMRERRLVQMADAMRACLRECVDLAVVNQPGRAEETDALLAAVERTARHLSRVFGEDEMLMGVWRGCFVSEWFGLQQRAGRMFGECEEIRTWVGQKTNVMCFNLLQEHNVDAVHRLIELLLKFDMKNDCRTCLGLLFDYQYWRRDLRACSEIMRSSLDIDAPLSEAHNQKLLNLLLGTTSAQTAHRKPDTVRGAQTKFELKF